MSPRNPDALNRIEFFVLAVLAEGPLHGYGIAQDIERRTGGEVKVRPGSLYRVLDRLVRKDLISHIEDGPSAGDDRRNDYGITELGLRALRDEALLLASIGGEVLAGREKPA